MRGTFPELPAKDRQQHAEACATTVVLKGLILAHDNTIDQLNHLLRINKDAEAGFQAAAEKTNNTELETLFGGYAKQHAKFADDLRGEIERLGGKFTDSETFGGALRRGFTDLRSTLSGHSAAVMLASCERAEESAEIAYDEAADQKPTGQTRTLIEKQRQQIKEFRTRLARLVGETKDGVDFQKNE